MLGQTFQEIAGLYKYRYLLLQLVSRELKVKYKRSILGFLWSMLNPLLMMVVLSLVFSTLFKSDIPRYTVYVFAGLLFWNFFSSATSAAMGSVVANGAIIKKVYVPKIVYPIASVCSALVNLLLSLIPLLLLMLVLGNPITPAILFLPISILIILIFSVGISLLLANINVFFRDVSHIYGIILLAVMYLTPIMYPDSIIPRDIFRYYQLNPLYGLLRIFRLPIHQGILPDMTTVGLLLALSLILFFVGVVLFVKNQNKFINYL